MSKRNSGEQKRENSQLKITFSVLIMVLSFLAELYTMIILKGNPIYLAGFGLVFNKRPITHPPNGIFNFFLCADEQRNAATVSEVKRRKRRA